MFSLTLLFELTDLSSLFVGHGHLSPQTFTVPVTIEVSVCLRPPPPFLTQVTVLDAEFRGGGGERRVSVVRSCLACF